MKIIVIIGLIIGCFMMLSGCRSTPNIERAENVDLDAFMGNWYVIANIPTFLEKDAHNAVETYERGDENLILTTFAFNKGGFKGERKEHHPKGYVQAESNAYWKMQFLWPFKSEFIIAYVDENYQYTIIGRSKRDYLWIMARQPKISEQVYQNLIKRAVDLGYEAQSINQVPQQVTESKN